VIAYLRPIPLLRARAGFHDHDDLEQKHDAFRATPAVNAAEPRVLKG